MASAGSRLTASGLTAFSTIANGKLVVDTHSSDAAVSSGDVRVALKTASGNDPSPTEPVFVAFPSATTGLYEGLAITTALSLTYPIGGQISAAIDNYPFRIWVLLFNDSGTFRLALTNRTGSNTISALPPDGIATSVSSGSNLEIITPGLTVTAKPFRIIGYLDWSSGLPTQQVFSIGPDVNRLFGAGVPLPGTVLQQNYVSSEGLISGGSTLIPYDDTIPQRSEGDNIQFIAITAASPCNIIVHECVLYAATTSGADPIIAALHYQSGSGGTDALATAINTPPAANKPVPLHFKFSQPAPMAGSIGYEIHVGGTVAGTVTTGGVSSARKLGGVLNMFYASQEIMG